MNKHRLTQRRLKYPQRNASQKHRLFKSLFKILKVNKKKYEEYD